jgi:molecular chaperone HscC
MIVGIDLGTTNSAVGVWKDGAAVLVPNRLGSVLTPSAVSVDTTGEILVGAAALDRATTHPERTATHFKRYMATGRTIRLGKQEFLPEELSAFVLRSLKADAEAFLGEPVSQAVITVPAYFNDRQRKATRRAGELAGLTLERLVNEPTAAALSYGVNQLDRQHKFLVFDLGGGTFDVSVLEVFEGVMEVRATAGDSRLGGQDFNELLFTNFLARGGPALTLEAERDPAFAARVRVAAEAAKRRLSEQNETVMSVVERGRTIEMPISAERFETLSEDIITRMRAPVLRALNDGRIGIHELDQVLLVGGATRMPIVRRAITRMFGRFPSTAVNPDEAVALGAAVQAGLKSRDAALREVVLTDVCPFSLGVGMLEGGGEELSEREVFSPILERNTTVPASRERRFCTVRDNQTRVDITIFQGESVRLEDNVEIGSLEVPVPPESSGRVAVDIRFTYDINGILEVDVSIPQTGVTRQLVIVNDEEMSPEEVARRRAILAGYKLHPRENEANRAAVARAERCFETTLGAERTAVRQLLVSFEHVLNRQDPKEIERARALLLSELDELERRAK